ncbi:MAG: DUF4815 domain-containing protein [Candidatus Omnitrophica bacterium]|nr:DUF4815 domain-containing protein [Candidatus Omnitrophota bacterium]
MPIGYKDPWTLGQIPPNNLSAVYTETISKGISGSIDALSKTSVLKIVLVKQNSTVYEEGVSFQLTDNKVDWTLAGSEPAPTSSYEVVYRYSTGAVSSLLDEYGRKQAFQVSFVQESNSGTIIYDGSSGGDY